MGGEEWEASIYLLLIHSLVAIWNYPLKDTLSVCMERTSA